MVTLFGKTCHLVIASCWLQTHRDFLRHNYKYSHEFKEKCPNYASKIYNKSWETLLECDLR